VARQRLSTVYMPGHKITMLPDDVVAGLHPDGRPRMPGVSLYVTLDEASLEVKASETRVERVPIAANLRHDQLDASRPKPGWKVPTRPTPRCPSRPRTCIRSLAFLYRPCPAPQVVARSRCAASPKTSAARLQLPPRGQRRRRPAGDEQVQISIRRAARRWT
jgi:exoribonuclease-2